MAWEWSHTPEAYADARDQVAQLDRAVLLEILREWAYDDRDRAGRLPRQLFHPVTRKPRGFRLPAGLSRLSTADLADLVWTRMEELRTCTNGGHEAYCCPDGCHTVPFDPVDGDDGGDSE